MYHSVGGPAEDGWNIWGNGYASTNHTFSGLEASVAVRARGDFAQGQWPHMVVSVGGIEVGAGFVTTSQWTEYEFPISGFTGTEEVRVTFDNDAYAPPYDRNLYVERVVIGCQSPLSSCEDGVQTPPETDLNCGGGLCPPCGLGSGCAVDSDCASGHCATGTCGVELAAQYSFEHDNSGWANIAYPGTTSQSSSAVAFDGEAALRLNVSGYGNPLVAVLPSPAPPNGSTVTFRVFVPLGAPVVAISPYVQDLNWSWNDGYTGQVTKGQWQEVSVNVPGGAAQPLQRVGLKAYLNASYNGPIYVDAVEW
jgi:hypothetical protein